MEVKVVVGDVLDFPADVLVSTANPWLNMSGGVNGAICERCPGIQEELHSYLETNYKTAVPAGSAVSTSAGTLSFSHIVHAVAIDPFYDSSLELLSKALVATFENIVRLNANSVSMPTLATGYGPMSVDDFAFAFRKVISGKYDVDTVNIVVRMDEHAESVRSCLNR